ncbi:hypothetical protein BN946_scf184843.g13 [Trametes cinnabarina]|uniref:Fungal-type protein kinase domain-containing protein n=1 Tax=Pycnoporus cinnabarinus TaxID=5643 RepID=A0A060SDK2_PYCCI|nr:hypothetical protein BN946_scf184843.g13 [Trametes cinnabarina]
MPIDIDHVRFASTRDFLDNILPVEQSTLDRIYRAVREPEAELYVNGRWSGFPDPANYEEANLHKPFVKIANEIAKIAGEEVPQTEDRVREASWKDYHSDPPRFLEPAVERIRPECTLSMAMAGDAVFEDASLSAEQKEKLWWLQFVAVVEARSTPNQNEVKLVLKLVDCLRSVMIEQKDRRFVLGILLSAAQASVWLHDRSGVLGMSVPVNVHENPKDFVHIIAAMSVLPAHRLGFDPDMRLAREPSPPIHMYRLSSTGPDKFDIELYRKSHYVTQWVIDTKSGAFITLSAISLIRTNVAIGSGCMVWAVIRYVDRHQDPSRREVFVLKQQWKSKGHLDEGAIYEELDAIASASGDPDAQYLGQLELREIVEIEGEVDNTATLIQRGLKDASQPQKRLPAFNAMPELCVNFVDDDRRGMVASYAPGWNAKVLRRRTRTRVVLKTFGCSIKFFTTLPELLTCFLHAVRGHRFAYVNGYVHGDVSTGNLLITTVRQDDSIEHRFQDIRGCLIDFDHAKEVRPVSLRKAKLEPFDVSTTSDMIRTHHPEVVERITEEVMERACQLVNFREPEQNVFTRARNLSSYIEAALQYHEISGRMPPPNKVFTPEHLGWNADLLLPPTVDIPRDRFRDGPRLGAPRTGTPPYASAKILNEEPVEVGRWRRHTFLRPSIVVHDAIHDMESLSSGVLLHLCMTHSGPGDARRAELVGEPDPDNDAVDAPELRRIVYCFFEGPLEVIAWNKREAFRDCESFEPLVLRHIHPYFEPLRPLLRRWWELLLLAYGFEGGALHELDTVVSPNAEQRQQAAREKRHDFFRKVIYAEIGIPTPPAQQASAPPSRSNEYGVMTAFDTTSEAQRQKPVTHAHDVPRSTPSPTGTPVSKKARKS